MRALGPSGSSSSRTFLTSIEEVMDPVVERSVSDVKGALLAVAVCKGEWSLVTDPPQLGD